MKIKTAIRLALSLLIISNSISDGFGQDRKVIPFNSDWKFTGVSVTGATINEVVNLPHTWNASDTREGIPYYRGVGYYEKHFTVDPAWIGKRIFIRFEGVMTVAGVSVNSVLLGEHRGGYSAFCYEITPLLDFSAENVITVRANNEFTNEVLPLVGDFNLYGGIYRPVSLIITSQVCISPLDYASPGVYLKQKNVSKESADIEADVKILNSTVNEADVNIEYLLSDAAGIKVLSFNQALKLAPGENSNSQAFQITKPHLWNGISDPYLYHVQVNIWQYGRIIDSKTEPLGIRWFKADPDKGFFLNGEHVALHGVSRHQERAGKGSALSYDDHRQDMDIMLEMGINSLRLAHYQHSNDIYNMCDSSGVIVWAEIPFVGAPGGIMGKSNGYEATDAFHSNARQQLTELIRQNYNHPSICFWSIFNEIQNPEEASPVSFIKELNELARKEDPSRLTTGASMLNPKEPIHDITDIIAFNRYFGWYYKDPEEIGKWLDKVHKTYPELCIGLSEYGAGGSISQHSQSLDKPNPFGSPHPEEYESYYHEQHLKAFNERPYVWGTYVWTMFDFGSQFRREGDHYGINDKGLVTYDRKTKKDAYYFYKANWSNKDVLYITSRRNIFRTDKITGVKVYSNMDSVSLIINEKLQGVKAPESGKIEWNGIELMKGINQVLVKGVKGGRTLEDRCVWVLEPKFGLPQMGEIMGYLNHFTVILIIGLIAILYTWYLGFRRISRRARAARFTARTLFYLLILVEVIVVVLKILVSTLLG